MAAGQLRVRSALNPMLWLCAIVSIPCFILSYFAHGVQPLETILWIAGAIPIVTACSSHVYFMLTTPEKLQSEEYQLRHETLDLIRQKGVAAPILPASLEMIENPLAIADDAGGAEA
jgi:hypothetical protein